MTKTKRQNNASKKNERLWFDELSMREAEVCAVSGKVVIIPIGSTEEHGNHLPLCTDSLQSEHVALEVARKTKCLVAPPLRYGVCNSTRNFPGTISIKFDSLHKITRDILEEFIRNGFTRILVLSGHAGQTHMTALKLAAREVVQQYEKESPDAIPRIAVCSDYDFAYELRGEHFSEKDGHAGTIETSRMMIMRPNLVDRTKGVKSFPKLPRFEITANPTRYFPAGVIGDPTIASTKKGRKINKHVINKVSKLVEELARVP